ncbi:hypothetical protein XENTR_v10011067 [Xenopus tropicalis]|uniref:Uncharacterized protein LOC116410341 n=1 Tax=Xenopus tropicalis TaxID=8364 RepID=A0A8J1JF27_XENTR|nr:uncharacterized protein LOC116410341 [Xenopus tropicalis]KAE8607177.1 hypothetical protein XENTR_v10011067 [Xenopus tropicalis]
MGPLHLPTKLLLHFALLSLAEFAEFTKPSNHRSDLQEPYSGATYTNATSGCNIQNQKVNPVHHHLQQTSFVWTTYAKDEQFGIFRFGIRISKNGRQVGKTVRDTIIPAVQVRGNEQVNVTVAAETNQTETSLMIISCQLVNQQSGTRTFFIHNGCLDDNIAEEVRREDSEVIFSLRLSGVHLSSGTSSVLITCEVKLCQSTNESQPCLSKCPLTQLVKEPFISVRETGIYHVTTKLIYAAKELRRAATNYTAVVVGLVLGGTVVAVVVLLVRKSFSGVRHRNATVDL